MSWLKKQQPHSKLTNNKCQNLKLVFLIENFRKKKSRKPCLLKQLANNNSECYTVVEKSNLSRFLRAFLFCNFTP